MGKKIITFLIVISALFIKAQPIRIVSTGNYQDPYWLAENVLVDTGFSILPAFNPPLLGVVKNQPSSPLLGFFDASGTSFPIDSGIVMATAHANSVIPGSVATNPGVQVTDPDLLTVLSQIGSTNNTLYDKAVIEFSFFALSDSIDFRYVFSSQEYSSWTCSDFNDVFGFFLTGQEINGNPNLSTVNLATIPNTTIPVAINTVNQGFPSGGNATPCLNANPNYVQHSIYYNNNTSGNVIGHYGYTDVFRARAKVKCGFMYHIKLIIADVFDGNIESAVFLEANSFKSPKLKLSTIPNSNNTFNDTVMVEGCTVTKMVMDKPSAMQGKDFGLKIITRGTAVEGVDYLDLPDSIWMPANVNTDTLYIYPTNDGTSEGIEDVIITIEQLESSCNLPFKVTEILYIDDKDSLKAEILKTGSDTIKCPQDFADLTVSVSGGNGNLNWWWEDDPSLPLLRQVAPSQTTTYKFFLTDECASDTIVDSITIYNDEQPPVQPVTQQFVICKGDEITIFGEYTGGLKPIRTAWRGGSTEDTLTILPDTDSLWYPYQLIDACGVITKDSIQISFLEDEEVDFDYLESSDNPFKIIFSPDPNPRVSYSWDFGDGSTSSSKNPEHLYDGPDEYSVSLQVLSANGCYQTITKDIKIEAIYKLFVPNAFSPNGDGTNDFFEIGGTGIAKLEIWVYNRWGEQIFYSGDKDIPWDGTINGSPAPTGTYSYRLQAEDRLQKVYLKRGSFQIIR